MRRHLRRRRHIDRSVDFHARGWVDAFAAFGHSVAFDEVWRQIGKGGDWLMPVFLSRDEVEKTGKAPETHRGTQVALGSSAKEDELADYKKNAGIDDLVGTETSSDDAEHTLSASTRVNQAGRSRP